MITSRADLRKMLDGQSVGLISCLSFEERSLEVAEALLGHGLVDWTCFQNEDIEVNIDHVRAKASSMTRDGNVSFSIHETSKKQPLRLADAITSVLDRVRRDNSATWVIDISTMTHEMLLIVVAALDALGKRWPRLRLVYSVADQYSTNESDKSSRWVSRGIQSVRSVIGYPGLPVPGEPTTLIALPGFDLERVSRIVDDLEPDRLVVGIGTPHFPEHAWMYEQNVTVAQRLLEQIPGTLFEYESLDPKTTAAAIVNAGKDETGNVVLISLNSKLSTVAAGLVARNVPHWQVCYAPALIYNTKYASVSERFIVTGFEEIRAVARSLVFSTKGFAEPALLYA